MVKARADHADVGELFLQFVAFLARPLTTGVN